MLKIIKFPHNLAKCNNIIPIDMPRKLQSRQIKYSNACIPDISSIESQRPCYLLFPTPAADSMPGRVLIQEPPHYHISHRHDVPMDPRIARVLRRARRASLQLTMEPARVVITDHKGRACAASTSLHFRIIRAARERANN